MSTYLISGIQQVGIGNRDVHKTWEFYRKHLGFDLPIFDEAAEAKLMLPYTNNEVVSRHAILALNYGGGGGLEIWQYTSRIPKAPEQKPRMGDLGITSVKYKCQDINKAYADFKNDGIKVISKIHSGPLGLNHFFAEDLEGNLIEITESDQWYKSDINNIGGVEGVTIGVSDMEKSLEFYKSILGYDIIEYAKGNQFEDFSELGDNDCERVLLSMSGNPKGSFSKLLGRTKIELVKTKSFQPIKLFNGRQWGDLGYIHLCYDVTDMDTLKLKCEQHGHPFTVDSADSFDMGEAAGRFAYIEDPDGTLIEFVETHKIPIMKTFGWFLDLRKRDRRKPLPNYILRAMAMKRVK